MSSIIRPHAEDVFAAELKALAKQDKRPRPENWQLSPQAVVTYLLGGKTEVPTPTGAVKLSVPAGTSSGKTMRLKGKGVKTGDLLVKLMIELPEDLTDLQGLFGVEAS